MPTVIAHEVLLVPSAFPCTPKMYFVLCINQPKGRQLRGLCDSLQPCSSSPALNNLPREDHRFFDRGVALASLRLVGEAVGVPTEEHRHAPAQDVEPRPLLLHHREAPPTKAGWPWETAIAGGEDWMNDEKAARLFINACAE
ncbi:hypothetical protein GW17_00003775 [Ensete ventricosum]|nr:hypothetical protein GW17_00003775 [Ensete ventricosum]